MDNELQRQIDERIKAMVPQILKGSGFTDRKVTDIPTDSLQVVNRKYVTMNGTTANRPTSSVIGQRYFDTTLNKPVWVGNSFTWVDSSGSPA